MSEGREWSFWLTLCSVYLFTAGVFSALAPIGSWDNWIFGFELWLDSDPGGCYIASAHELFSPLGRPLFPGHPGLTLQMLLHGIERAFFLMQAGRGEELTSFVARNLHQFGLLARMLMTLLHLASFYLLFLFSRRLFPSARSARLAVVGYATSLPVLYYLSRVSVEPLVVIFFLATFLGLWSYRERLLRGAPWAAAGFAAVAAVLAVSGVVTKFHLLLPLPVFGLLYVVMTGRNRAKTPGGPMWKVRSLAAATFVLASSATFFFYSLFLNWQEFFEYWGGVVGNPSDASVLDKFVGVARRTIAGLGRNLTADNLLPSASKNGIFFLCELSFLVVALAGLVLFFRCRDADRRAALWPLGLSVYTLAIFAYRSTQYARNPFHGFHYLFVLMAVMAVFFGVALDALGRAFPKRGKSLAMLAVVLLVHNVPVWAVLGSRLHDARAYRPLRPLQTALESIRAGQRVGVLHHRGQFDVSVVHGLCGLYSAERPSSVLADEFASMFVPIVAEQERPNLRSWLVDEAAVAVVVDLTEEASRGRIYSAPAWADAKDAIRELLSKLPSADKQRDPEVRQRVLKGVLDGTLESRSLGDDRVRLASVTEHRWTVADRPAVVVVQNPGNRPLHLKLRIGTSPESAGTRVSVFVDDGRETFAHQFEGGSSRPVPLPGVPAGDSRLFLVWSETPETAAGHPGKRGIRVKGTRFRPRDGGPPS